MKKLIFEAHESIILKGKKASWIRISFWRWLWMVIDGGWVIRTRWVNPPERREG